ncbi:Mannose-6-phosphate isomerase [Allomyces arbusculus]|nr:Mannose-6-phosphate isomerase [Allomyces arbusculus]
MSESSAVPPVLELRPRAMHYAWGKRGTASAVARLATRHLPDPVDEEKPYAELWMGTHPNAPSTVLALDDTPLPTVLASHPSLLGTKYRDLPFLFKVLSVGTALSIQAHPDKPRARALHAAHPDVYKDPNHKPEMAIALTHFEALYGFRAPRAIDEALRAYPEFARVAGEDAVAAFWAAMDGANAEHPALEDAEWEVVEAADLEEVRHALRELLTAVMTCDAEVVRKALEEMVVRIAESDEDVDVLLRRVHEQYPGDVGVFCVLLMNHVQLSPGQALFMGANELHAYLAGDCIEVMATSDNVVRAGLTPKLKDVETLTDMLTYAMGPANLLDPVPHPDCAHTVVYDPPIPEFAVHSTTLANGDGVTLPALDGPSVLLVTGGTGRLHMAEDEGPVAIAPGSVYLVAPGTSVPVVSDGDGDLIVYRAYCDADLDDE